MGMLKKATNKMAYAKVGFYGEAGSGKTFTAAQMAIGLHKHAKLKKPVAMFDTEPAASFLIPHFDKAGIEFLVYDESRALSDLMTFMDEAENECSIIIIDSVTHLWKDIQDSYVKKINAVNKKYNKRLITQLEFHHWRPIKAEWGKFTDRYLSCKAHCFICGRAGSIYEYQDKPGPGDKKELITTGTKMATEKEMGYEPSLLIEMVKKQKGNRIINTAIVDKDRSDFYQGKSFDNPNFETFKQHFDFLNIGGNHFDSMNSKDSTNLFDDKEAIESIDMTPDDKVSIPKAQVLEFVSQVLECLEHSNGDVIKGLFEEWSTEEKVVLWRNFNSQQRAAIKDLQNII